MAIDECLEQLKSSNPFMHGISNSHKLHDYIGSLIGWLEYAKLVSELPCCNTCKKLRNGECSNYPDVGQWCRINCYEFESEKESN